MKILEKNVPEEAILQLSQLNDAEASFRKKLIDHEQLSQVKQRISHSVLELARKRGE